MQEVMLLCSIDLSSLMHFNVFTLVKYLLSCPYTSSGDLLCRTSSIHVDACFASPLTFRVAISMLFVCLAVFEPYKDSRVDTLAPKLLFTALNLAALALGVWKVKFDNLHCVAV